MENNKNKKIAFLSLGCKVNYCETESMKNTAVEHGFTTTEFDDQADVYVINTCTVTHIADRKSRQMLHRARTLNKDALIVAVGCYAQNAKETLFEEGVDILVGNNNKSKVIALIEAALSDRERSSKRISVIDDLRLGVPYEEMEAFGGGERVRVYMKIQDGCNQFCSYCMIPYVRGRIRSRSEEEILKEAAEIAKMGYREIVLTGIHISSFGRERKPSDSGYLEEGDYLIRLLEGLNRTEGISRIRLGSLEPGIVTPDFARRAAALDKLCPHFHLSLQSGCDATLKRMNRRYDVGGFRRCCEILREYFDSPAITTDVIAGFPGETDEEFTETLEFVRSIAFSRMHIFKFSVRRGTKAEKLPSQVSEGVKAERSRQLIELNDELEAAFAKSFLDKCENVLFEACEEIDGEKYLTGLNERYVRFAVPCSSVTENVDDIIGRIVPVRVLSVKSPDLLVAKICRT